MSLSNALGHEAMGRVSLSNALGHEAMGGRGCQGISLKYTGSCGNGW